MKKRTKTMVLMVSLACLLAGCASDKQADNAISDRNGTTADAAASGGSAEADGKFSVKMSHHPYIHALPSYYAEKAGIYQEVFGDYTIDMYANGPVQNEAIASDSWEVGTTGLAGLVLGAVGYDLKAIGVGPADDKTTDIWVRPDSPLAQCEPDENGIRGTAEDWKGLTFLCASGNLAELVLGHALEYQGLTADDITMVNTDSANSFTAFKAGEGDVTCLVSPYGYNAEAEGWVKVCSSADLGMYLPTLICATEEAISNNSEMVQAWLETFIESGEYLRANPDETARLYEEFSLGEGINVNPEECKKEVENRPFPTLEEQVAACTADAEELCKMEQTLLDYAEFMMSLGKITEEDYRHLQENSMVDTSFVLNIGK